MKASELVVRRQPIHRHVGVEVPEGRSAVGIAVALYRDLGIDVDIVGRILCVKVGRALSAYVAGALERATGIRAFNEWETS